MFAVNGGNFCVIFFGHCVAWVSLWRGGILPSVGAWGLLSTLELKKGISAAVFLENVEILIANGMARDEAISFALKEIRRYAQMRQSCGPCQSSYYGYWCPGCGVAGSAQ